MYLSINNLVKEIQGFSSMQKIFDFQLLKLRGVVLLSFVSLDV